MERLTYEFNNIITGINGTSRFFYKLSRGKLDAAISKLREYEDAEEQGLLVRLPCKVGDRIYMAFVSGEIRERTVTMISTLGGCEWAVHYGESCEGCVGSNDFGEWVFLTREEAEAALAKDTNVPDKDG